MCPHYDEIEHARRSYGKKKLAEANLFRFGITH